MIWKLKDILVREAARFEVIRHQDVYTAQERAAVCRISGRVIAKVVVVHDDHDDWYALAVLPATASLDIRHLREVTERPGLRLARGEELARTFPHCAAGAMPPFGRIWGGLDVYLDRALAARPELVFGGGTHDAEVRMAMSDYVRIEGPDIVPLALTPGAA